MPLSAGGWRARLPSGKGFMPMRAVLCGGSSGDDVGAKAPWLVSALLPGYGWSLGGLGAFLSPLMSEMCGSAAP